MKKILLFFIPFLSLINTYADEGMWIPMLLKQNKNIDRMQALGCKLSADDIYNINQSSLKDAIVLFGAGCTGELVSNEGLIITNHHCGYGNIQAHSSVEHDYLTNGFWAMSNAEELPNEDLSVSFLVRMEDVTQKVLSNTSDNMNETERNTIINNNIAQITKEATKGTHYEAKIKPFYYGNQYFMFVMETFNDVRLVGAPPSSIGKFGGDTDNWMWPRHTGDFSMFRIYADKNNNPAPYSKDNVPYKPKKFLNISLKGVDKGDFTMVYGFPGRTQEFLTSYAVNQIINTENPAKINLRDKRLKLMASEMDKSSKVRIQYSAKYAYVANGWKKWIGESKGLKRLSAISKKELLENEFKHWANSSAERSLKYGNVLPELEKLYKELQPLKLQQTYIFEAGWAIEVFKQAYIYKKLTQLCANKNSSQEDIDKELAYLKNENTSFFKDYYLPIDKKMFVSLMSIYQREMNAYPLPDVFELVSKNGNNFNEYAETLFNKSLFTDLNKTNSLLNNFKRNDYKKIMKDPVFITACAFIDFYNNNLKSKISGIESQIEIAMRRYVAGLMEMQPDKIFYPDANSTLRIAYGVVDPFQPVDAVKYDYFTTIDGIIEKENPDIYDYAIPNALKQLHQNKDYGMYADKDGNLHTCFIATNHTTGGNSGSPVLDAEGNLIGVNFDRAWEGTMSDIMYDPTQCRNITLDIRYALFVIDKLAGAKHLIREMNIIK